jgi:uncharacterized protein (DUF2249 family)
MSIPITPETKVGALLEAYPGVEDCLISWVPAFSKLKNPVLRKTVTKLVTLEQAAKVAGVELRDLIARLHEATGQQFPKPCPPPPVGFTVLNNGDLSPRPAWADDANVRFEIDADALLEKGEHPMGRIRQMLASSEPGQVVKLKSSFRPAPLIEALRRSGVRVHWHEAEPGRHLTYIAAAV